MGLSLRVQEAMCTRIVFEPYLIPKIKQFRKISEKRSCLVFWHRNRWNLRYWVPSYRQNEFPVTSNRTKCIFGRWFWRKWNRKIQFGNESINETDFENWLYTLSRSCLKKFLQLSLKSLIWIFENWKCSYDMDHIIWSILYSLYSIGHTKWPARKTSQSRQR